VGSGSPTCPTLAPAQPDARKPKWRVTECPSDPRVALPGPGVCDMGMD
jgi:hypothetical protein